MNNDEARNNKSSGEESSPVVESRRPLAESWTRTKVHVVTYIYMWAINNFSLINEKMRSSLFSSGIKGDAKWCIEVCPLGYDDEGDEVVTFYLILVDTKNPGETIAKCRFSLVNGKTGAGKGFYCFENEYGVKNVLLEKDQLDYGYALHLKKDILRDKALGLLTDDQVTVVCEITVSAHQITRTPQSLERKVQKFKVPECPLVNRLEFFYAMETTFDDVTLIATIGEKYIKAHMVILAAASPRFDFMFQVRLAQCPNQRVIIEISDIEGDTLVAMLEFIYSGKVKDIEKRARKLLEASEEYHMPALKRMCEKILYTMVNIDNCLPILQSAIDSNSDVVKRRIITLINDWIRKFKKPRNFIDTLHRYSPSYGRLLLAILKLFECPPPATNEPA